MTKLVLADKALVASFDVDAQKTFTPLCPNELPVPGGDDIVAALNTQATFAQWRIGSKDAHSPSAIWVADAQHPMFSPVEGAHVDIRWAAHAVPGTPGFELLPGLPHPSAYDYFVWKGVELDMHPYGACYHDLEHKLSTGVIEFLRSRQVQTVIVGGLATDYCVQTTVQQLLAADLQVVVNLSACRGIDAQTVTQALQQMRQQGADLVDDMTQIEPAQA